MYDLIVIGGGPAGTSAAITAARGGASVLLMERAKFPRHKVCGEFVSAESLGLLSQLFDPTHRPLLDHAIHISQARIFLDGRTLHTAVNPPAASIARFDLDISLWASASKYGVDARQEALVQDISGTGPYRLATSAGEVDGRAVINASGRWSNLAASTAGGNSREKWVGIKGHFEETVPNRSVDLYFFDGGYCGVQPVNVADSASDSRVNACAMVRADVASTLPQIFALHPELAKRSRQWRPLSKTVTTSPLFFRNPQPVRNNILFAGDAAGFVDPFVGDGISLGLRSGALAAGCLIPFFARTSSLLEAACRYRETYELQLGPIFRASSRIRRMLLLPSALRKPILFLLQNTPTVTRYLVSKTR